MIKKITDENMQKYFDLAQLYEDEFSPITGAVKNKDGSFPVSTPIDETHIGYFYCEDTAKDSEIGFIVINAEKEPYDICEFFIHKDYRNKGAGQKLAFEIFDMYSVDWSVKQLHNAKKANLFWLKLINKYTSGDFTQHLYEDKKWGKVHMQLFSTKKIKLFGFNNLTKSLCLSIYEVYYVGTGDGKKEHKNYKEYIDYINNKYSSKNLSKLLVDVVEKIDATVLNISKYDYEPQGASAVLLIAEEPETIVAHLDKSHIAVHTYPEYHPANCLSTFRVDIDVATCGEISPLSTINQLLDFFNPDIITLDYKVRGFTRTENGEKLYMDIKLKSIQDYINNDTLSKYISNDVNMYHINTFHTRMMKKDTDIKKHQEITEIYQGLNI